MENLLSDDSRRVGVNYSCVVAGTGGGGSTAPATIFEAAQVAPIPLAKSISDTTAASTTRNLIPDA